MRIRPLTPRPELTEKMKRSAEEFAALPQIERDALFEAQKRSFVHGETGREPEGPNYPAELIAARAQIAELTRDRNEARAALARDARVDAILEAVLVERGDPEDGTRDHLPRRLRDFLNKEAGRAGLTGFNDGYVEGAAVQNARAEAAEAERGALRERLVSAEAALGEIMKLGVGLQTKAICRAHFSKHGGSDAS